MAEPLTSQAWVAAWLRKADHDMQTAERALHGGSPITDTAAYHCHQAAEKSLKAFLAWRAKPLVRTHDLMDLLTRCANEESRFVDWADRISVLSAFGTVLRYPSVDARPERHSSARENAGVAPPPQFALVFNAYPGGQNDDEPGNPGSRSPETGSC